MGVASGLTRLEKYLIIKGFLEKSLKIVLNLGKHLNFTIFCLCLVRFEHRK